jgi:hypothetical protein
MDEKGVPRPNSGLGIAQNAEKAAKYYQPWPALLLM